jgi:hypothetical protein
MNSLSFATLAAGEHELRPICEAHASKPHYDGHDYKFKGVEVKPATRHSYLARVTIHLESIYADGFQDEYSFDYAIYPNGGLGRFQPQVPLSQQQVFDAYDTWGFAVERWVNLVKGHYCLKLRKARFALVHEELAAKMWHPDRVSALLERGGWDAVY